jgi:hypothetical protein
MKRKLIALLAAALVTGMAATAFAVTLGNVLTGPTVTVTAPTAFVLTWGTQPPTTGQVVGARSYATFTVSNPNKEDISDYALFIAVTGTGVTATCAEIGSCVMISATYSCSVEGFSAPCSTDLISCYEGTPPCPVDSSTTEELYAPVTVPAGLTLVSLGITYGGTGTFITSVSIISAPSEALTPAALNSTS